jgi:hypothetical protein
MSGEAEKAAVILNTADALLRRRALLQAKELFDRAEQMGADPNRCAGGRWFAFMLLGNFQAAWQESDAIHQRTADDTQCFWQGEDLRCKRIMLRCLHGFGDAIQFLRFAPRLQATAAQLIVEVPPRLLDIAPYLDGVSHVITWGEQAPAHALPWDVQIEINELAYVLRLDISELPVCERYLRLPRQVLSQHRPAATNDGSLKVGVVWAGGDWNPSRSIPFHDFRPIFNARDCEFWNLQGGIARNAWPSQDAHHLHEAESCKDSILALAATIAQLDLVITSDTLAAHLAGAQGTPCWVLLQHEADWRWLHDRADSPWYRSLRLFRCGPSEDWRSLTSRVAEALRVAADQRTEKQAAMVVSNS